MARFVGHENCPACGSRDNLGRYDDGSAWCFGCKYTERATHAPRRDYSEKKEDASGYPAIPDDAGHDFGAPAVEWLAKYGVSVQEAIQRGLVYSNYRQQLIFKWKGLWQARNFSEWAKAKNFTSGEVNEVIPIYSYLSDNSSPTGLASGQARGLVIPEDPLSALRIARQCDAMPLLGSHLATSKLVALVGLGYSSVLIWLDHDKLKEARDIASRAKHLGLSTTVVYTELDPKEYSDQQIEHYVK